MGMQFEYDEEGATFYYFLLACYALILWPVSYFYWPTGKDEFESVRVQLDKEDCVCEGCVTKRTQKCAKAPSKTFRNTAVRIIFCFLWIGFIVFAYQVSQIELTFEEFDPYAILGIDRESTDKQIKKAFHSLSKVHHPDMSTGDEKMFVKITKAYKALTNEESRKNWQEYNNPDGPGVTQFGIALPKWLVEEKNSMVVLGIYVFIFMFILPITVGIWWSRSAKFNPDKILNDTSRLYGHMIAHNPHMLMKKVISVLAFSREFWRQFNKEIIDRETDFEEISMLIKSLPSTLLLDKKKEHPFLIKTRTLIYAHLYREPLPPDTLENDKNYIISKCINLLNEMINLFPICMQYCSQSHIMLRLDSIENMISLQSMIVQAIAEKKSSLLQLPFMNENLLRHFVTKRRNIRSVAQFLALPEDERRSLLRTFSAKEYDSFVHVAYNMPSLSVDFEYEVLDDEDGGKVTAGSLVTLNVTLKRRPLGEVVTEQQQAVVEEVTPSAPVVQQTETKAVRRNKQNGRRTNKPHHRPQQATQPTTAVTAQSSLDDEAPVDDNNDEDEGKPEKVPEDPKPNDDDDDQDDPDSWKKFLDQQRTGEKAFLEERSVKSHPVHCPFYPDEGEKQEFWWVYLANRKAHKLVTPPQKVTDLVESRTVTLKYQAPQTPQLVNLTVCVRSDSYTDVDVLTPLKLQVLPARKYEPLAPLPDDIEKDSGDEVQVLEGSISSAEESDLESDAEHTD